MRRIGGLLAAFGRFWWDFLVGENPLVFLGTLVVVAAALLLRHERAAAIVTVPSIAVAVLVISTYRARQRTASD